MRTKAPALLPVFRSRLVGDILALTMLDPSRSWRTSELAERTKTPYTTVARELRALGTAGILVSETAGRTRIWRANTSNPNFKPLRHLVSASFGPAQVVAEEFGQIPGAQEVWIYGSWAARSAGEQGPAPGDIDVLVLGRPQRTDVFHAAQRAEERIAIEVNTTIRDAIEWDQADDGFARTVKSSPRVQVLQRNAETGPPR